jgi:hypothetical protein
MNAEPSQADPPQRLLGSSTVHFLSGGTAGCLAKSVVAPLDRVKILFQVRPRNRLIAFPLPYFAIVNVL